VYVVAQFVEMLRYKPEGRGFDWGFPFALIPPAPLGRLKYLGYLLGGKGGRYIGLTTLPLSCADCLEIMGASTF